MDADLELQGVIIATLKADPAVTALVAGRVYDAVPTPSPTFPYITYGPSDSLTNDADCITGFDVTVQIDAWSRAVGFPEVKKISDAVRDALHDKPLSLPVNALVFIEHRQTRTFRDPDGLTSHAAIEILASVERQPAPIVVPPPPTPTIQINALVPDSGPHNVPFTLNITGVALTGDEQIVFRGTEYEADPIFPGQIRSAGFINPGSAGIAVVYLKRGPDLSNELTFTVT